VLNDAAKNGNGLLSGYLMPKLVDSHICNHFVLDLCDFNPYRVRAHRACNSINCNNNSKAAMTAGITTLAVLSAEACLEEDELPFVSIRKENVESRVFLD
jgi:hypothetical protein